MGCLADERFTDPVLLEARRGDAVLAIGLFNRRRGWAGERLWLGESGDPRLDAAFIEHNGLLVTAKEQGSALTAHALHAALHAPLGIPWPNRAAVLSGIPDGTLRALQDGPDLLWLRQSRPAPYVDLAAIRDGGGSYLGGLSPNTRYQLRRSARRYGESGALHLRRAATLAEAHGFLAELVRLHQQSWTARGEPGAFARPEMLRFHNALVDRGWPRQEIDLLRVAAGERVVGYLYNFRHRGRVSAYQSGFDYAVADPHEKPGLTCHHLAIEACLADGAAVYDFLGGSDRYKTSLANAAATLHWAELLPRLHPRALLRQVSLHRSLRDRRG